MTVTQWIGDVFRRVVTDLLGWQLDPRKAAGGSDVVVLGLQIRISGEESLWRLASDKGDLWVKDIQEVLHSNSLSPGFAAKLCGRLAFVNAHVFNRIGRALLRPIIWRQRQSYGSHQLTQRLRFALTWFLTLLNEGFSRSVSLQPSIDAPVVIIYSDAEHLGGIGAVAEFPSGDLVYLSGRLPRRLRRLLRKRMTNIVAYELLAALVALVALGPQMLQGMRVIHFIDSTSALACVVRGYSAKQDLCMIAGRIWYEACGLQLDYRARWY